MNISIVIPNYNGATLLQKNLSKVLDAVKTYKQGFVEIIIPDDPSTDNSPKIIANFIADIKEKHVVGKTLSNRNKKEAGFAKNVNRGVSLATGDILILLNTDVVPHATFLEPLLRHFSDATVFAVGCLDESLEKGETVLRGRGVGNWQRGFLIHKEGDLSYDNTLWVSGGSGAFRKKLWDKLGGLDTLYNPFYWEDIDISYRALKAGYVVLFEKESVVSHEHEAGVIKTKFKNAFVQKIAYRNQFIFVWKNITQRSLLLSHVLWLPYHFLKALGRRDRAFFLGFWSACLSLSRIQEARRRGKKLFKKTDRDILDMFKNEM